MTGMIALTGLSVRRGATWVVRDIDLSIPGARWFGVIGANGSGKTTLLRAVAGRLPISTGRCEINGADLAQDRAARARTIGFAPPIERLPGSLRVRHLLELAGEAVEAQHARSAALWQALELDSLLNREMARCSSGMRQRVSLALAFANPVPIVVLDEPFNWLDPVESFDVKAALSQMVEGGLTLVSALHDLTTLCSYCNAGMVMSAGQISLQLTQDELRGGVRDVGRFEEGMIAALR